MYGRQYCNVSYIQVQIMDFVDVGGKAWRGGAMAHGRRSSFNAVGLDISVVYCSVSWEGVQGGFLSPL